MPKEHWATPGKASCRMSETVRGVNTGDDPEGWCIGVGDMADYEVQTGKGRYITYDEAMQIIQKAEDLGFVHQITNIDGKDKIFAVCNCQKSVCYGLRTSQLFNTPNFSRSAYIAHVDSDKCVACGQCVGCGVCTTKCEFDAIHLSRDLPECSDMYVNEDKLKAIIPYALKRAVKIKKKQLFGAKRG